ncbi:MAG: hypothetical protein JW955_15320 [Sedimentisphaerales bacterium]|nr:hypothetical protein [Sedimentisphaerales bacterium]
MSRKLHCMLLIGLLLAMAGSASAALVKGTVRAELWYGGIINDNVDNLKATPDFPDNPAEVRALTAMDLPDQPADYFGARLTAWLTPPQSGDYTFWTASDDDSEVWLSTDDNPDNKAMICNVEGWTGYRNFTGTEGVVGPNQQSQLVTLEAGKRYYMEVLMSDGTGGGCVTVAWAGPGIGANATVLAGTYLESDLEPEIAEPLFVAKNPDPADGAVDVVAGLFTWTPGMSAKADDIYLGTTPELGEAEFQGKQPSSLALFFYPGELQPDVTYYWRVDTTDTSGALHTGVVWSFHVMPVKATEESPADGTSFIVTAPTLTWKAGQNFPTHDLYLGTDKALVEARDASVFMGNLADPTFDPGTLDASTTYYWCVDEQDALGQTWAGDVWSFTTTLPGLGAAKREIWSNIGGVNVSDLLNDPNFPCNPDIVDEVPAFASDDFADNYGGRLSAWLHVPVAGDYTFWVASDDASQLFFGSHPGKAVQIAQVSGWTGNYSWDWYPEQKSQTMALDAGVYYIEALWKEGGGGDNCSAAWEGPGLPMQLIGGGYLEPASDMYAVRPSPADGATGVFFAAELTWTGSCQASAHDVYFGTSESAVAGATTKSKEYRGRIAVASYEPGDLTLGKTYYWRVDEIVDPNTDPWKGAVWSFTVSAYSLIDDFEAYEFAPVAPKAAIGWWKFDGDAKDSSGKGHDGAINGDPTFVEGVSGQAIHMDGVDDFVVVGSVGISGAMPRTIAGWAKADTTNITDWTNVFGFTSTPDAGSYLSFDINKIGGANQYCIHIYGWETGYVEIDLEWHHLAATYDGTTIKWYHGGKVVGSYAQALSTIDNVQMGKRGHDAGGNWPGSVDDVRIYSYALSELEIKSLAGYVPAKVLADAWTGDKIASGSLVTDPVQQGGQAMKVAYDTWIVPCVGAVAMTPPYKDLTRGGADAISLWLKGRSRNQPNWWIVALMDTNGALFPAPSRDMWGLSHDEWTNVVVPLKLFAANGVNVKSVAKIGVGALAGQAGGGSFCVDDIRLIKK